MNISFVNDVHFWGNIKAIGADNIQLKYIANYETNYFVLRGLPIGLLIGAFVAEKFVPFILRTTVGSGGYVDIMPMKMWYSGWLFCLTIGFCYFTVWISFRKSIRILIRISPVEAIRFNGEMDINRGKQKEQHRCNGKLYKMAWHNIIIERKKFFVVVTTLFFGFFVFLLSYTMFSSPNWELYLNTEAPDDFSIKDSNVTDSLLTGEQGIQYLTEDMYYRLEQMQGITSIEKTYVQPVTVKYLDKLQEYSSNTEDLFGTALGTSGEVIQQYALANEAVYSADDINEFMKGNVVYISAADNGSCPDLTGDVIQIYIDESTIQTYTIAGTIQPDTKQDIRDLGSITNTNYTDKEKIRVFMSEAGIKKLTEEPCIYYIQINADKDLEPYLKEEIRQIIDENNVQIINRSDLLPTFQPVAQAVVVIGSIFSGILLIIGLMNFINALCTSIYARQKELAVLSSIGMSKQQMIRLLSLEGGYYAIVTFVLLSTIGMGLIYLLMQVVKSQMYYLEFKFPIGILALLFTLLFAVCILTPLLAYKSINKKSIVERLKNNEE
jgi:putative ABC transport system permease protein